VNMTAIYNMGDYDGHDIYLESATVDNDRGVAISSGIVELGEFVTSIFCCVSLSLLIWTDSWIWNPVHLHDKELDQMSGPSLNDSIRTNHRWLEEQEGPPCSNRLAG
jgi:hypothetical protein